jgi:hypothetical protein
MSIDLDHCFPTSALTGWAIKEALRLGWGSEGRMARFAASLFAACLAVSILGARADTAFTQTAPRPPLPVIRHGKLAAKEAHAAKKGTPGECQEKEETSRECQEKAKAG